ncbi:MAG: SMC-Scp complex subunit ScpB [Johnsonella sp.]|nr:SMC-Scp complex subunit ScpB [Johnsonella sp.]
MRDENIIEAVLFTMGKSVELRQLAIAIDKTQEEAKEAVERLILLYQKEDRAMQIIELEDAYQMCTKAEYFDFLIKVAKAPKKQILTEAVLETLSIIAYKQPITKAEIEKIRGVSSEYSVNKLMEYGLVNEAGRLDAPGRPALFATTEEFLRRFALDSARNLPGVDQDSEAKIMKEAEEEAAYQFGFIDEEKKSGNKD